MAEDKKWSYTELLKHPKWQKKRLLILERDNFTCRYCSDKETELHIHHLKYHKNPWDAKDENLLTLCKDCHGLTTFNKEINIITVIKNIYSEGLMMFYVKQKVDGLVIIEMITMIKYKYDSLVIFNQNGIGIKNLLSLNND